MNAAESDDTAPELRKRAGRWAKLGARPTAAALYERVLELDPDDVEALRFFASNEVDPDAADRRYRRLSTVTVLTVADRMRWAAHLWSQNRFLQATDLVESAVAISSTPDERLDVAEALVTVSGGNERERVLALAQKPMTDNETRATNLLIGVLARSPMNSGLNDVAELLRDYAIHADAASALGAVDALLEMRFLGHARAVWEAVRRPPLLKANLWPLTTYLSLGGRIAVAEGRADHAVKLYGEVLTVWNAGGELPDAPLHERVARRSSLASLESQYVYALIDAGRFSQAIVEADNWQRKDEEALSAVPATSESPEQLEDQGAPDTSTIDLYSMLRSLARAIALVNLGDNQAGFTALFDFDRALEATGGADEYAPLRAAAVLLGCLVESDPVAARERIERVYPPPVGELDREATLQRIGCYRLWAERDQSFVAEAGDVVRQELARRDGQVGDPDPTLDALLSLYAGQLHRARATLDGLDGADEHDEMLRAVVALELHDADAAAKWCDALLVRRPYEIEAELLRAEIELERHAPDVARMLAQDITDRRPYEVDAHILVADCCYELARELDDQDKSRIDVGLLASAANRYHTALELSANMESFLRDRGAGEHGHVGSTWLSARARQRAALRGATCAVRAAVLLERRRLPQDRELNKVRRELIGAIVKGPARRRLESSALQNGLARTRRRLRNVGLIVGAVGGVIALLAIIFPAFPVPWPPADNFLVLAVFVLLALFPTVSEFTFPGGIGFKRQVPPPLDDSDLQSTELQLGLSRLSSRLISLADRSSAGDASKEKRTRTGTVASPERVSGGQAGVDALPSQRGRHRGAEQPTEV